MPKIADKIKAYTTARMEELDNRHIYYDGESIPLPSVSEILRVFSFGDFAMVNQEKLDEAAHIGHAVHATIANSWNGESITDKILSGGVIDEMMCFDIRYQNCMKAYDSWLIEHKNIVPLAIEKQFVSQTLGFGGTVDFIGRTKDCVTLYDWKTGNQIKHRDFIQLECYALLLKKCAGVIAKDLVLVHLSKETGEYKERRCPDRKKSKLFARRVLSFWKQTEEFKILVDGRRKITL